MSFLGSSDVQRREFEQLAAPPTTAPEPDPGLFEGSAKAIGLGVGRVAAVASQFAGAVEYQAGALVTRPIDDLFDTDYTARLDEITRKGPARLTAAMTPDPVTTGSVGKVLYSLVGVGVPAIVGGVLGGPAGAAAAAGAFQGGGTATDLAAQGVDDATAAGAGVIDAALTAAGVAIPASIGGKVALNALLFGPGVNVTQDVIAQKTIGGFLEAQGYPELGERYGEIQSEMIVADIILGAAFGAYGAKSAANLKPRTADIDTAQIALDRKHIELDTAPGIPADVAAMNTHTQRLKVATEQLLAGEPVRVDDVGDGGVFVERPRPLDGTKVADESGAPIEVYHGTGFDFETFQENPNGIFFGTNRAQAESFSKIRGGKPRIIAAHLDIKNPWTMIKYGDDVPYSKMADQSIPALKSKGYDGIYRPEDGAWIAFYPEQIVRAADSDDAIVISALKESGLPGVLDDIAGLEDFLASRGREIDEPTFAPVEFTPVDDADAGAPVVASDPADVALDQVLNDAPEIEIATPDGARPAIEASRDADAEVAKANKEAPAFDAAVACFLRTGDA